MDGTPTIGIFEGGGARGLAHIGAVKACDKRDLKFESVAGTSFGAIVGALVAAGYSGDEMLSLRDEHDEHRDKPHLTGLFGCDFYDLIDAEEWGQLERFSASVRAAIHGLNSVWARKWRCIASLSFAIISVIWAVTYFAYWATFSSLTDAVVGFVAVSLVWLYFYRMIRLAWPLAGLLQVKRLVRKRGFVSTSKFEREFNLWLARKCFDDFDPNQEVRDVTFHDLKLPLTVVTYDVVARQLVKFSRSTTPNMSVAKAVSASMAVPFVFRPVEYDGKCLIDGGAASAFPAWAVDDFLSGGTPFKLVLGFRLGSTQPYDVATFMGYLQATSFALIFGDDSLERRRVPGLIDIRLPTSILPWQFNLTNRQKREILRDGSNAAYAILATKIRPPVKARIETLLQLTLQRMRQLPGLKIAHLRANLALPIGSQRLQICCTSSFDAADCDDCLEFDAGVGATGQCWETGKLVAVNLGLPAERAAGKWNMTKYQQKLVREGLRSLLSIPVARSADWVVTDESYVVREGVRALGVLNFDSDVDVNQVFRSPAGMQVALDCAQLIVHYLDQKI